MSALASLLMLVSFGADPAQPAPAVRPLPEQVQAAVRKSIEFLEDEGVGWKEARNCASCHHLPEMIWALNEAKAQGYQINDPQLKELTDWVLTNPKSRIFPKSIEKPPAAATAPAADDKKPADAESPPKYVGLNMGPVMLALGLKAMPAWGDAACDAWNRFAAHAIEKQEQDGSWLGTTGRPPLLETQECTTLLATLALIPPQREAARVTDASVSRTRAIDWVTKAPTSVAHQALTLRLLLLVRNGRPVEEFKPLIDELRKRQNPDGSWSQIKEMAGDAVATGQSVYVLRAAGTTAADDAIQRAVEFLLKTQTEAGSWTMISRPVPPSTTLGTSGNPTSPISYVGTMWATLALVNTVPQK